MGSSQKTNTVADKLAQAIRGITVPPILVSVLLILLYFVRDDVYTDISQLIWSLVFLVIIPLLAYPVSYVIPAFKAKGRKGQRTLAFICNLVGYAGAAIYGVVALVNLSLFLIYLTYLISVLVLILFNKVIKVKASGHACGVTGPLIFFVYFTGLYGVIPCVIIAVGVVWSSLRLKRHTATELLLGAVIALLSFLLAGMAMVLI